MDVVVFPDTVALLIGHLTDQLPLYGDDATVHREVPDPRPERFVRLFRTGGVTATVVSDAAQITVEAWAASAAAAHDLAQLARGVIHATRGEMLDGVQVYRVDEFGGPVDLPDPDSNQQRYTFTVVVHARGATVAPVSA